MTHNEKPVSEQIRKCIADVRELQKNAEGDDQLVLSTVLGRLMHIQSLYQEILEEKEQIEEEAIHDEQWIGDKPTQ